MVVVISEEFDNHWEQVLRHHVREAGLELLAVHGDVGDLLHKLSPHVGFCENKKEDSQIFDNICTLIKLFSYAAMVN